MAQGDHLVVSYGIYTHHGVDLGDGRVVQYGGLLSGSERAVVETVELVDFAQGRPLRIVASPARYDAATIVVRALSRLGEARYSLLANNCEHFVHWCRGGTPRSRQAARVVERIGSAAFKRAALRGGAAAFASLPRRAAPLLLAADAVQWGVECAAAGCGDSDDQARRKGRAAGLAASIGIGLLGGGPLGAAAGGGLWALGDAVGEAASRRLDACAQRAAEATPGPPPS